MSKLEQLLQKYSGTVTKQTFEKFVFADTTPTRKYLAYMLKTWEKYRKTSWLPSSFHMIEYIQKFDELLPYMENKDIYSNFYDDISNLVLAISNAEMTKVEKTFDKKLHVDVLYECDDFLMVHPKTYLGSLKYGANTKWCTASKTDEATYNKYMRNGYLVYVISKNESVGKNYQKVAFNSNWGNEPLFGEIETYNQLDNQTDTNHLSDNGWDIHNIFTAISIYRANFGNALRLRRAKNKIDSVVSYMNSIDFNSLSTCLKIVENADNTDYISNVKNQINEFVKKIPVNI